MSALWNPLVTTTVTLRTTLTPPGCAERLSDRVTLPMEAATRDRKPLAGSLTAEAFNLHWRSGYAGDVRPVARGRFETDPAGTVVVVRIGMQIRGWIVVLAWTIFSVGFGALQVFRELGDTHVSAAERAARAAEALGPPGVMLSLLGIGMLLAAWVHRRDTDQIIDTLKCALEATTGPDFRPVT